MHGAVSSQSETEPNLHQELKMKSKHHKKNSPSSKDENEILSNDSLVMPPGTNRRPPDLLCDTQSVPHAKVLLRLVT